MMPLEYRMTTGRATTKLDPSEKNTATGSRCGRLSKGSGQEMYVYNIYIAYTFGEFSMDTSVMFWK